MKFNITTATAKGPRPYQEDRFVVSYVLDGYLFAVMDGHGGDYTADLVSKSIERVWVDHLDLEPVERIKKTFEVLHLLTKDYAEGTTLSLAWVSDSKDNPKVYVAVLGDSPVIVSDKYAITHVSVEHNVRSNAAEEQAVIRRGGFVEGGYAWVNYSGAGLQMSRALGDCHLDKILSREPDITSFDLGPESFILLGSDGCFDPGHSTGDGINAVLRIVKDGGEAQAVVDNAVKMKIYDNSTAILVKVVAE